MAAHVHTSPVLLRERAESARFSLRSWRQQSRADGASDAHTQQVHDHLNCEEGTGAARERQVSYWQASERVCYAAAGFPRTGGAGVRWIDSYPL